ncbi:betaine/proline/choline family ABC transporter ATP-binding protein [Acetobacterium carbinolicum]|jgi:osmoprotectant transport system ATP-binding protein|uniref:betaine/proline/choline family ABC transporter ATP-binding protein n=1 Tax=Acetobacterium TaxID=33951 RepID=UPI000DBECBE4|nr:MULTISPECIES: ABC transporter ATP-binding protein [unclassified Acetobacterium]AWW27716.1 osmoprotectant [Acetobacterium sp. KB-1]MDZ5725922.1 ABC transporter ATP-binding protein [Acetobacterium sp. K1/6]
MIRFESVKKKYGNTVILDDLSFNIEPGEFVVLIGPSGCGKTTTLKSINRLIKPEQGKIFVNGEEISQVNPVKLRRKIGYVIQQIGLFPNMTIEQNIGVVPKRLKYSKQEIKKITKELMEMVDMSYEEYAHKYPPELSGGQQQRIGVLRALAASPPIVLMDEPFGALDPMTRATLQKEIVKLHKKLKKTIVFVTHDMNEALDLADKIIFMEHGKIIQMATPEEMLANPASPLIRDFMRKSSLATDPLNLTAADFMSENVISVQKKKSIRECTDLMARQHIDSLVIKNEDETYAGVVTIKDIKKHGKSSGSIGEIEPYQNITSDILENAKDSFDKLYNSGDNYVVVLNSDQTVAGIISKTSMATAMADTLWGDMQ